MKLSQIVAALPVQVSAGQSGLDVEVTGGYAADLLSCVIASARCGNLLVTLQGHLNAIAVASLNDLAGIIVTENKPILPDALAKADEEGIPVLTTHMSTFEVIGRLWDLGVRA